MPNKHDRDPVDASVASGAVRKKKRAKPLRYKISRKAEGWVIEFRGESFGPYRDAFEATTMAIAAVRKLGAEGMKAKVCVVKRGKTQSLSAFGAESYLSAA